MHPAGIPIDIDLQKQNTVCRLTEEKCDRDAVGELWNGVVAKIL